MTKREDDIAKLSPEEKRKLLSQILRKKATSTISTPPLKPILRDGPLPLSFSQERLWFLSQLEPDNLAYNLSGGVRFKGRLRPDILERSILEIVQRHEILRTTFNDEGGKPVQVVSPAPNLEFQHVDLEEWPEGDRAAEVRRLAAQEARRPFDLLEGPLVRAVLVRLGMEEYVLVVMMHHIITDGWSMGVFAHELESLYRAFSAGLPSPLTDLPIQYADYAVWQQNWLQGGILETQLAYWKKQLSGNVPILQLPTDRPRPAVQTHNGSIQNFHLSEMLLKKLRDLSIQQGVTLYVTLLAAFKTLLFRYTGQKDFAVGSPIANRGRSELEGLIGLFVNNLVLRTDLSGNPSFIELMKRVRKVTLDAYSHQDVPFEKLVEILNPERNMSHAPLFQVMFSFQNFAPTAVNLPGLTLIPESIDVGASMFDLTVYMQEEQGGLSGKIEYNTDLFNAETISRLIEHFENLLEEISANPNGRVMQFPLIGEAERHKLLLEFNATEKEYPRDKTLADLFEEQVARTPEAVAVVYGENQLSYRELNSRANQLAHHLMKAGVGPEVMVGIYMERSLEMVIAIYGIVKAGGAYVPLDPEYPSDRVAFMLDDTQVPAILTQQHLVAGLPEHRPRIICLDSDWNLIDNESTENPARGVIAENLAYVIYTSGSTGKPKGAMNEHRGIVNRLLWMQDEYSLTQADRVLQKTPFSFDVSVWEFFWPLQVGACLVMAIPEGHRDSAYLVKLIMDQRITTLHFVPSMLNIFLQEEGIERCKSIKRVICSGEALSFELQRRFFERLNVELHNLYGPTEAAVDVTYWACTPDSERNVVPIGYPVANTQMYILDAELNPVPMGCIGELHIGGVQVARGYLKRPELTAERFLRDPFKDDPKARLYNTGDLARYLSDGSIEYIGRSDFQVKIRGLRVELGEIEARLEHIDVVQKCVVMLREDRPGDQRLVAYYVVKPGQEATVSNLRKNLQTDLPDYMIPSIFEPMDELPLTSSGKVNRLALPIPSQARPAIESAYTPPSTETEHSLVKIWQEVLEREKVGINDDFFELGGHSLLATQVLSRINQLFNLQLPLRKLFENRTVGTVADLIEAILWTTGGRQAEDDSQVEEREVIDL
jgi:amino acid adenylation domain-containing protein